MASDMVALGTEQARACSKAAEHRQAGGPLHRQEPQQAGDHSNSHHATAIRAAELICTMETAAAVRTRAAGQGCSAAPLVAQRLQQCLPALTGAGAALG